MTGVEWLIVALLAVAALLSLGIAFVMGRGIHLADQKELGMAAYTDDGAWTCPHPGCGETYRGAKRHLRHNQRAHARRHGTERQPSAPTPRPATIPKAPPAPRRTR